MEFFNENETLVEIFKIKKSIIYQKLKSYFWIVIIVKNGECFFSYTNRNRGRVNRFVLLRIEKNILSFN